MFLTFLRRNDLDLKGSCIGARSSDVDGWLLAFLLSCLLWPCEWPKSILLAGARDSHLLALSAYPRNGFPKWTIRAQCDL
jgi:hypothetical protein